MRQQRCHSLLSLLLLLILSPKPCKTEKDVSLEEVPIGKSTCSVYPLVHDYYFGVNLMTYEEAIKCCETNKLTLANLNSMSEMKKVRTALLSVSYYDGRDPYSQRSSLHIHHETQNLTSDNCHVVFLRSRSILQVLQKQKCYARRHYLCSSPTSTDCTAVQFTPGKKNNTVVSSTPLPWRAAATCCERVNKTLIRLRPNSAKELPLPMWTSTHRPMTSPHFIWLQNNEPLMIPDSGPWRKREFCVSATSSSGKFAEMFKEEPCETPQQFACSNESTLPPKGIELKWTTVSTSIGLQFKFSQEALTGSFKEALKLCSSHGFRLMSAFLPVEGDSLASLITSGNEGLVTSSGFWVGAKVAAGVNFHFPYLTNSPDFVIDEVHHPRFVGGDGKCLEFIPGGGTASSFALKRTNCALQRGVLCETQPTETGADFIGVGHRYMYSKTKMTQMEANFTCELNGLRLFLVRDTEESRVLFEAISKYAKHTTYLSGFWTGAKGHYDLPMFDTKTNYMEWAPPRRETRTFFQRTESMMYQGDSAFVTHKDSDRWCNVAFWLEKPEGRDRWKLFQWKRACNKEANFICEIPSNNPCSKIDSVSPFEEIWVSPSVATWHEARFCCDRLPNHKLIGESGLGYLRENMIGAVFDEYAPFWTSGSNALGSSKFLWTSGEGLVKNYESVKEQHYCLQGQYNGNWIRLSHHDCWKEKRFICTKKRSLTHPSCSKVEYQRIGKSSFFFSWDKMSWFKAAACCHARAGVLAKISTKAHLDYVFKHIQEWPDTTVLFNQQNNVWIGLASNLFNDDNQFGWLDGWHKALNGEEQKTLGFGAKSEGLECVALGVNVKGEGKEMEWRKFNCSMEHLSICFSHNDMPGFGDEGI